jgi:hypothetical protein
VTKPAKDEAELIGLIADTLSSNSLGFTHRGQAVRALAAIRAAGWAVVPIEPIEEIRNAVIDAAFGIECITEDDDAAKIYQAAIKAAAPGVKP